MFSGWRNTWNDSGARATPERAVSKSQEEFKWNGPLSWMCGTVQHIGEPRLSSETGIILENKFLWEWNHSEANFIQPEHLCCAQEGCQNLYRLPSSDIAVTPLQLTVQPLEQRGTDTQMSPGGTGIERFVLFTGVLGFSQDYRKTEA